MPATASVQIKVFGDVQFSRKLMRAGFRAEAAQPLMESLAFFLSRISKEQFESQGARSGQPWQPLAPSTVARKGHDTILVDSGALRDSFQYGGEDNIWEVTNEFLRWGSDVEYGIFHQQGTTHLPVRKVFWMTEADKLAVAKSIQRWIVEGELINLEVGIV
jgi:phage gpG-like protein